MFGSNNQDNGGNHDDRALGPPMSIPDIPPMRVWNVMQRQGGWFEQRIVEAHEIEMSPDFSVVRWREFFKDEHGMPNSRIALTIVKAADGWLEYSEQKPEPVTKVVLADAGSIVLQ